MKVKELIERLSKMDQDKDIILQRDPEGNGYSPISDADEEAIYYDHEVYSTNWTADEACIDEKEWEELKRSDKGCVVLYPKY